MSEPLVSMGESLFCWLILMGGQRRRPQGPDWVVFQYQRGGLNQWALGHVGDPAPPLAGYLRWTASFFWEGRHTMPG